jgi:hypothetical protein
MLSRFQNRKTFIYGRNLISAEAEIAERLSGIEALIFQKANLGELLWLASKPARAPTVSNLC